MTTTTIQELAEVIADQNCHIRELYDTVSDQEETICNYELDQERAEKQTALFYAELKEFRSDLDRDEGDRTIIRLDIIMDRYLKGL